MKRKRIDLRTTNHSKKRRNKIPAVPMTVEMAHKIDEYFQEAGDYKSKRDSMLLMIGLTTGYRLQDIVDLKVRDLRAFMKTGFFEITEKKKVEALKAKLANCEYIAIDEEGDEVVLSADEVAERKVEPRVVEMLPEIKEQLKEFLSGEKGENFAFRTTKCDKKVKEAGVAPNITRESYSKIISKAAKAVVTRTKNDDISGAIGITGHSLRKGYALNIYETTGDINKVKEMLGHSSVEVTKRYLWPPKQMKHEASKNLNKFIRKR